MDCPLKWLEVPPTSNQKALITAKLLFEPHQESC